MRRIDLFCKLAGPLFIALINGASTKVAIFVLLGINAVSVPIEYLAIAQVFISKSSDETIQPLINQGVPRSSPSQGPKKHTIRRHRNCNYWTKSIKIAAIHSPMDLHPHRNPQTLLPTSSLHPISCAFPPLLHRPRPRQPNDNLPNLHRLQLLLHRPSPNALRNLRALRHLDSATSYEANRPCPSRHVVPKLASAMVRNRSMLLLGRARSDHSSLRFSRRHHPKPHRPLGLRLMCPIHHPRGPSPTPFKHLIQPPPNPPQPQKGSPHPTPRLLLHHRSLPATNIRAPLLHNHNHMVSSNPIPISNTVQRSRCLRIGVLIWEVLETEERTSCAFFGVGGLGGGVQGA